MYIISVIVAAFLCLSIVLALPSFIGYWATFYATKHPVVGMIAFMLTVTLIGQIGAICWLVS